MKILCVEDETIIFLGMESDLKRMGHQVDRKINCKETLQYLQHQKVDAIMLDVGLDGDIDGIETAKLINEKYSIPIIFVTGSIEKVQDLKIPNVIGCIVKPTSFIKMKTILDSYEKK